MCADEHRPEVYRTVSICTARVRTTEHKLITTTARDVPEICMLVLFAAHQLVASAQGIHSWLVSGCMGPAMHVRRGPPAG
jgi:hypothetical protein